MPNGTYTTIIFIEDGKVMNYSILKKIKFYLITLVFLLYSNLALCVDNPDSIDYLSSFLIQANKHEESILQGDRTTQGYIEAYAAYEDFLNKELSRIYRLLTSHLSGDSKAALDESQRNWNNYIDSEFHFITSNWNRVDFGSSSVISRGGYRTTLIKDRIILLLHYLQNY